jgi:hypothetical protein
MGQAVASDPYAAAQAPEVRHDRRKPNFASLIAQGTNRSTSNARRRT